MLQTGAETDMQFLYIGLFLTCVKQRPNSFHIRGFGTDGTQQIEG